MPLPGGRAYHTLQSLQLHNCLPLSLPFGPATGAVLCFTYTVSALALTTFNSTDSPMLLILRITEKTHKCLFNDLTTTPISSQADFPFNTLKQVSPDFQGN